MNTIKSTEIENINKMIEETSISSGEYLKDFSKKNEHLGINQNSNKWFSKSKRNRANAQNGLQITGCWIDEPLPKTNYKTSKPNKSKS